MLSIAVPVGVILGLLAGYLRGTVVDTIIMRVTDVFLSVPSILLALAIAAVMEANMTNTMLAVTIMWWPWYCRVVYSMASSLRSENYVISAELMGASRGHILFREILPGCLSPVCTKMALDVGWVILLGATLNYVGLGVQDGAPSLGQMLSDGVSYMPEYWWMTIFPPVHHPRSESDAKHCRPDRHSLSGQGVRGGGYPHLLHHPPASLHADAALGHPGGIRFKLHAPYFTPEELALFLGGTAQKFVGD